MKRSDLFREYVRVIDMCEGTGVPPQCCINVCGVPWDSPDCPTFTKPSENYEFALAILEGKPVFKGDELYFKNGARYMWGGRRCVSEYITELTWTKPRTFTLNGEVLPRPRGPITEGPGYELRVADRSWFFESFDDRAAVEDAINKILSAAENS